MIAPMPLRDVMDVLAREQLVVADAATAARAALQAHEDAATAWYVRALIIMGTWLGGLFWLGFLLTFFGMIFSDALETGAIFMGLVLLPAAVFLRRASRGELGRQASLVLVFAAQGLLIGGSGALFESLAAAAGAALVTAGVCLAVFPDPLHRFVSTLVAVGAIQALAYEARLPYGATLVTVAVAAVPLVLWRGGVQWPPSAASIVDPVATACALALLGLVLADLLIVRMVREVFNERFLSVFVLGWPVTAVLSAALVWLAHAVFAEHGVEPASPGPIATASAVAVVAVLTASSPAIVAAVLVMVLGFDRRRPLLVGVAAAFLVAFGAIYYYYLGLTLLQKSGILVGTGVVCLAAAAAVRTRAGAHA